MKVLVLAGGYDQIALINEIKSRGHEVILADYLQNPPAKSYADKHFVLSTLDEHAILKLAQSEKVDLITTACTDQALLTVARVSEQLGLPCYLDSKSALDVTNKCYMKEIFRNNRISTADFLCVTLDNQYKLNALLDFPYIVKPTDCNSSKGVCKVHNQIEMACAVSEAFQLSRSKTIIVEKFVEGKEISIDVWVEGNSAVILSVSESKKIKQNKDNFTIFQSRYPVELSDSIRYQIHENAEKIALAFHLVNCPMLIQALIHENTLYVIEFSARMGGGTKYKLIEHMSGIDIMKTYVNRVLGNIPQNIIAKGNPQCLELNYIYAYNGTVKKIIGLDELKEKNEIVDYFTYKSIGDKVMNCVTSGDRVAGFLIQASTTAEILSKRMEIVKKIDILNENDESILRRDFLWSN